MGWKKIHKKSLSRAFSPAKLIAVSFALIIALGTLLLCLPAASRSGQSRGFFDALFTATSATCVTGLVPGDTYTLWSGFGQAVILCLIEIGGLGFMSAAALVILVLRGKVGLKQRLVIAQSLSVEDMQSVWRLQKLVLFGSLSIQAVGALVLFFRFLPAYGWQTAAKWGVFHAVSAFCNAGFDIFGEIAPGMSLVPFNRDPVVCITLMVLITLGGLGFFVWEELIRVRRWDRLSVYTRLVLLTGLCLTVAGAVVFMILEWDNPGTLGSMEPGDKVLNAFFQSVTLRTAGFAGIVQGALTDAGKAAGMVLMLIGGASGSTAGGMKTVTFIVLILFLVSRLRGKSSVTVFRKRILPEKVLDAMTIFGIMVGLALFGGIFICATSPIGFADSLYESVSALATVGVTANVTSLVSVPGRLLLVLFMYFGRVGVLTLSLGFLAGNRASDRFQYAHTNLFIG